MSAVGFSVPGNTNLSYEQSIDILDREKNLAETALQNDLKVAFMSAVATVAAAAIATQGMRIDNAVKLAADAIKTNMP